MDGIQPQAVDAEPGQVVQSAGEPGEITDTVAVGVLERLDVQAVDDCLLIPALGHVAPLSPWQPWQNASAKMCRWDGRHSSSGVTTPFASNRSLAELASMRCGACASTGTSRSVVSASAATLISLGRPACCDTSTVQG